MRVEARIGGHPPPGDGPELDHFPQGRQVGDQHHVRNVLAGIEFLHEALRELRPHQTHEFDADPGETLFESADETLHRIGG